jgi:hypothetical protein
MDFFHDLATLLEYELTTAGYVLPDGKPDESLVRRNSNLLRRLIPTRAYKVLESSELVCPPLLAKCLLVFCDIFRIANRALPLAGAKKFEDFVVAGIGFYSANMKEKGILL